MSSVVSSLVIVKRDGLLVPAWILTDEYLHNHSGISREFHKEITMIRDQEALKGNFYVDFRDAGTLAIVSQKKIAF